MKKGGRSPWTGIIAKNGKLAAPTTEARENIAGQGQDEGEGGDGGKGSEGSGNQEDAEAGGYAFASAEPEPDRKHVAKDGAQSGNGLHVAQRDVGGEENPESSTEVNRGGTF